MSGLHDLAIEDAEPGVVESWLSACRGCPDVLLDHLGGVGGACTVAGCDCTHFVPVVVPR